MIVYNGKQTVCRCEAALTWLSSRPLLQFGKVIFGQSTKVTLLFNINFFAYVLSKLAYVAVLLLCGAVFLAFPSRGKLPRQTITLHMVLNMRWLVLCPATRCFPDVALNSTGGYVVWQDNITDWQWLGREVPVVWTAQHFFLAT